MLEAEPFQLLICDLKMPKMDGLQVLAIVRRKYPQLRTVALTAEVDEQFRSRAYALGVDLFWHKPATEQETKMFLECIESLLGRETEARLPRRAKQEPHGHHPVGMHLAELFRAAHHQRPAHREDLDSRAANWWMPRRPTCAANPPSRRSCPGEPATSKCCRPNRAGPAPSSSPTMRCCSNPRRRWTSRAAG